jgi:hypothetical protein
MRKGVGVGKNIKLSRDYIPETVDPRGGMYCGKMRSPSGKSKGNPFECFKKGFSIGRKLQYGNKKYRVRENFDADDEITYSRIIIALFIILIVFGLLLLVNIYWIWALIIGFVAGTMFWYIHYS